MRKITLLVARREKWKTLGVRHKVVPTNKLRYNVVLFVSVNIVCCCRILLSCTSVKWAATVMVGRCVY